MKSTSGERGRKKRKLCRKSGRICLGGEINECKMTVDYRLL